ncbi:MAG: hypothetical protein HY658_11475 [Actinobacteria bacterium]|nr:hypothetical protein [Actinomycetota bacterium]
MGGPVVSLLAVLLAAAACTSPADPASPGGPGTGTPSGSQAGSPAPSPGTGGTASPSPASTGPGEDGERAGDLVWVAVEDEDRVVLVDVGLGEVVRRRSAPGGPHNLTVAPDGTAVVALPARGAIGLVGRGPARIVELGGRPHDVKMGPGDLVVVANEGARRLDLVSLRGRVVARIPLLAPPHDVAVSGGRAWVSLDGRDDLALVDLRARRVIRYVPTGRRPHDLLVDPTGRIWVTDWGGDLHVFTRRGQPIRTLSLGSEAHHLSFAPDGRTAWVTDHGAHRVFVIGTGRLRVVAGLPVAGAPHHVALTADGRWAVVADHDRGLLVVYDAGSRRLVAEIEVGMGPHGVWAVPG